MVRTNPLPPSSQEGEASSIIIKGHGVAKLTLCQQINLRALRTVVRNWSTLRNIYGLEPFTLMSDQDRISPYYISTISCRQVIRIKKNINYVIIN